MLSYEKNQWYGLYFVLYMSLSIFFFMNLVLAVVYNSYKDSLTQSHIDLRKRQIRGLRIAFEEIDVFSRNSINIEQFRLVFK